MNTIATMATSSQLTGGIQSKPGLVGSQPDMGVAQSAMGGSIARVSQTGGVSTQMGGAQSVNTGMPGSQGIGNPNNPNMNNQAVGNVMQGMGNTGMETGQGPQGTQMSQQAMGGVAPGQTATGVSGSLPDSSGGNQLSNKRVIWKGKKAVF